MASYGYDGLRHAMRETSAGEYMIPMPNSPLPKPRAAAKMEVDASSLRHSVAKTKAIILLGGTKDETQFRPLSFSGPKALFPVAGIPMIYHLMKACAQVEGMAEIILIGVFPENQFAAFVAQAERTLNIPVRYLKEFKPLGTGGGIYFFRDLIMRDDPDSFFVLHADVCADFPLTEMLTFHGANGDGNHVTVMSVKARKELAGHYGCLVTDEGSVKVQHYVEKPSTFVSTDINAGVYLCTPSVFDDMKKVFLNNCDANIAERDMISFEKDALTQMAGADGPARLFLFRTNNFWSQVKTAGSAIYANRHYLAGFKEDCPELLATATGGGISAPTIIGDVRIHEGAVVDSSATVGPNVTIGPGARVGPGARIKDSILLDGVVVGHHSVVLNSIIDRRSFVGDWARVEGAAVAVNPNDPTTHEPPLPLFSGDGRLNALVTVVGQETSIPNEALVRNVICMPSKVLTGASYKNQIIL